MADIFQMDVASEEFIDETDLCLRLSDIENEVELVVEAEKITEFFDDFEKIEITHSSPQPTFEELVCSTFVHNRLIAAKKILDAFQRAGTNQEELQSVVALMCKLSEDDEAMVRSELVQQIPCIALFCFHHSDQLKLVIRQQLVPYVVKLMNDSQIAVCKLSQSALLVLLENQLIDDSQLSEWICPYVAQLAVCDSNLEELRIEDVTLMSKMAPLVGKDIAMKFFLEPFLTLCCDSGFMIRKVCAASIGTFCKIIGPEGTEKSLLPSFLNLCNDEAWGVREACACVFIEMSMFVTPDTRREILSHIFIRLLTDKSRFVKNSAMKSLGAFISTFAGTHCPASSKSSEDEKHIDSTCQNEIKSSDSPELHLDLPKKPTSKIKTPFVDSCQMSQNIEQSLNSQDSSKCIPKTDSQFPPTINVAAKDENVYPHTDNKNLFNNFQFWRDPLPEIEIDSDMNGGKASNSHVLSKVQINLSQDCASEVHIGLNIDISNERANKESGLSQMQVQAACINTYSNFNKESVQEIGSEIDKSCQEAVLTNSENEDFSALTESTYTTIISEMENKKPVQITAYDQDIVPGELLSKYISFVTGTEVASDFDGPVGRLSIDERIDFCAYSFPAVAYTLGEKYWPCVKDVYNNLARNMKWIIRRTVASSLHELASILGHEITVTDLVPIFIDLMKDVDEVRLSLVRRLPDFLKCLHEKERKQFLPLLEEFSIVDNDKNWRFRCAIAEQLRPTLDLFSACNVYVYFVPIASMLIQDKVSSVRFETVQLMASIIRKLYKDELILDTITLLNYLESTLNRSKKWIWRQTYVFFCEALVLCQSLPKELYIDEIVPCLLPLAWDSVPNVRLAVARALTKTLLPYDIFSDTENSKYKHLLKVMFSLLHDIDKDVKFYATQTSTAIIQQSCSSCSNLSERKDFLPV